MKYYMSLFLMVTGFFMACNSSENQEVQADSTHLEAEAAMPKDENSLPAEAIGSMNNTGFSKYAGTAVSELDWSRFKVTKFWKEEFLVKSSFVPDKKYYEAYGQFLKYSPDSSKFIDLDSYNIDIHKNQKGQLVGTDGGPDTEISLVDVNKKQKMRLVFMGPGNSVEDATWLDNNTLVLIGFQENAAATATNAVVWKFDLMSKMVYLYELDDKELVSKLKDYSRKERLKNVIIR